MTQAAFSRSAASHFVQRYPFRRTHDWSHPAQSHKTNGTAFAALEFVSHQRITQARLPVGAGVAENGWRNGVAQPRGAKTVQVKNQLSLLN